MLELMLKGCVFPKCFPKGQILPSREGEMKERFEAAWFAQESKHCFVWLECREQRCPIVRCKNGGKDKHRLKEFEQKLFLFFVLAFTKRL